MNNWLNLHLSLDCLCKNVHRYKLSKWPLLFFIIVRRTRQSADKLVFPNADKHFANDMKTCSKIVFNYLICVKENELVYNCKE